MLHVSLCDALFIFKGTCPFWNSVGALCVLSVDERCTGSSINRQQSNEPRVNRLERMCANAFWWDLKLVAAAHCFYYPITSGKWCVHFQSSTLGWHSLYFIYFSTLQLKLFFLFWTPLCSCRVTLRSVGSSCITKVRSFPHMSFLMFRVPLQRNTHHSCPLPVSSNALAQEGSL